MKNATVSTRCCVLFLFQVPNTLQYTLIIRRLMIHIPKGEKEPLGWKRRWFHLFFISLFHLTRSDAYLFNYLFLYWILLHPKDTQSETQANWVLGKHLLCPSKWTWLLALCAPLTIWNVSVWLHFYCFFLVCSSIYYISTCWVFLLPANMYKNV